MARKTKQSGVVEAATPDVETKAEATETKPQLPADTFEADGVEYRFVIAKFNIPGIGVLTAQEALENEEALARLVEVKSSVIEKVKS